MLDVQFVVMSKRPSKEAIPHIRIKSPVTFTNWFQNVENFLKQVAAQSPSQQQARTAPAQATTTGSPSILLANKPGTTLLLPQQAVPVAATTLQQVQYVASSDLKSVAQQVGQNQGTVNGVPRTQIVTYSTEITNQLVKNGAKTSYAGNTVRNMLDTKRRGETGQPSQTQIPQKSPVRVIDLTEEEQSPKTGPGAALAGKAAVVQQAPGATTTVRQLLTSPVAAATTVLRPGTAATPAVNLAAAGLKPGTYIIQQTAGPQQAAPGTMLVMTTVPPTGVIMSQPAPATFVPGTSVVRGQLVPMGAAPTATVARLPVASPAPVLSTTIQTVTRPAAPVTTVAATSPAAAKVVQSKAVSDDVVILKHPAPLPPTPDAPSLRVALDVAKQPPPKPGLKISRVAQGIVLSWNMVLTDQHAPISEYQLFAYHEGSAPPNTSLWKKVGDVSALPLPMACTLTQFQEGNRYHFAVRAKDKHKRIGPFSDINSIHLQKIEK